MFFREYHNRKKMREYISDKIGRDYENWKFGQKIFIDAPTGSGKTTFILKELVAYAALKSRRILYLVNRTILKEQLENNINEIKIDLFKQNDSEYNRDLDAAIEIKMYQTIEAECKKNPEMLESSYSEYQYIVADECHYFLMDSMFNTHTQISFDWLMKKGGNVVTVFISATGERIKEYVLGNKGMACEETKDKKTTWPYDQGFKIYFRRGDMKGVAYPDDVLKSYSLDKSFANIVPHILEKNNDIVRTIKEIGGKWLIFVDSIKKGEDITDSLRKNNIETMFIDACLKEHNYSVRRTIEEISKENCFSEQVLMATSVMDNGISIRDIKVRNLMIMADTREEFMQMIGRKRQVSDIDILDVYILQRDKNVFVRRLKHVRDCLEFVMKRSLEDFYVSFDEIMESEKTYSCARNLCYVWEHVLRLNHLAFEQCKYLWNFYRQIIDKFEKEGATAFVREQLKWLEMDEDSINEAIRSQENRLKKLICEEIDKYVDKKMSKEENLELRESVRGYIKSLLEMRLEDDSIEAALKEDYKKFIIEFGKSSKSSNENSQNNRILTSSKFNKIVEVFGFKYKMKAKNEIKDIKKGEDVYCEILRCEF